MNEAQLLLKLPEVGSWIRRTLASHSTATRVIGSLGFPRLAQFYSAEILSSAKVVVVPQVPVPPLTAMGLPGFEDFGRLMPDGMTYMDTFFVHVLRAQNESVYFHELVHVAQWQYLGLENFLMTYARCHIASGGYATNPIETMAYRFQSEFENFYPPFDVEARVRHELDTLVSAY